MCVSKKRLTENVEGKKATNEEGHTVLQQSLVMGQRTGIHSLSCPLLHKPSWHMTSRFDSPERSPLIVFGHCRVSKCVFSSQSGRSHVSSSSQPQQHSSAIVNNHRSVWWAPECLSSETWLLHDACEEGSRLFFLHCETLRKMTADRCIALGGH